MEDIFQRDSSAPTPDRRRAIVRAGRSLLALVLALLAGTGLAADDQSPPNESTLALNRAIRLFDSEFPKLGMEHLAQVDASTLSDPQIQIYARLTLHAVTHGELHNPLAAYSRDEIREPRLAGQLIFRYAQARWWRDRDRPGKALRSLQGVLKDFPGEGRKVLFESVRVMNKVPSSILSLDPEIQAGLYRTVVDEVMQAEPELLRDPKVLQILALFEIKLDPEGIQAEQWIDRMILQEEGAPSSLSLRGQLELKRKRPDQALPWLLLAAYTTRKNHPDFPRYWADLSRLYRMLGWWDSAEEAHSVSASEFPWQPPTEQETRAKPVNQECRAWHDWLIDYRPQSLVRERTALWQSYVEDLQIWQEHCTRPEPDLSRLSSREWCHRLSTRPRRSLRALRSAATDQHPASYAAEMLCTVRTATLLPPGLDEFLRDVEGPSLMDQPDYWHARGLVELRLGRVHEATAAWRQALSTRTSPYHRSKDLVGMLGLLGQSPALGSPAENLPARRFAEHWAERLLDEPGAIYSIRPRDLASLLAKLERRLAPHGPAAQRWADQAILLAQGGETSLWARGRLELARGRPDRALPWLHWAAERRLVHQPPSSTRHSYPPSPRLREAHVALGWWPGGDSGWPALEAPKTAGLHDGDLLPRRLDDSCLPLLRRITAQDPQALILEGGASWQASNALLGEWNSRCQWDPRKAPGSPSPRPRSPR